VPGIAGIISRKPPAECERKIARMVRSMCDEPFYVSGTCHVPEMGLYAGWVAHEGSAAARQNASPAYRGCRLVLAGECFTEDNVDQSTDPGAAPCPAASGVLRAYEQSDDGFVAALNGLFSGLLIDRPRRRAILFNDRYAAERIYVHEADDATYFASEAKALLCVVPELRALDDLGVAQFLAYGCTLDWRTLFRGVRLAEGGSVWSIQHGEIGRAHV